MFRTTMPLDGLARRAVCAVALLHVLLFLAFAWSLVIVSGARADNTACTGRDMLAELQARDPAAVDALRREAAATPNGSGLLWSIERDGVARSWLFGTMHMADPRVTQLPPEARRAFDSASAVVIETTDVVDQSRVMAVLAERPDLMMFTDGTTLASRLAPEDAAILDAGLTERGISPFSVARMKPWILSSLVAMPACEMARKHNGVPVLDVKLAQDAEASGKDLLGLETAAEQLEAMASLPMEFHLKGLVETLKLGGRIDDVVETMVLLYARGDTGMFWPLFRAVLPPAEGDDGYAAFEETMINARNVAMARNVLPILERGGAFVAVGALHLPGDKGLIESLRRQGFTVKRAG
jgi:uncharacterized protein YbaP (TraB family)